MSPGRTSWARAFVLVALLSLLTKAGAATVSFPKLKVHVDALPVSGIAHHGYTPHRFEIHNTSANKRAITLSIPSEGGDFNIARITRTVTVAPSTSVKVLLLQPPMSLGYSADTVQVTVDGETRGLPSGYSVRLDSIMNTGYQMERVVLLSRSMDKTALENKMRVMMGGSVTTGPPGGFGGGHSHGGRTELASFETADTDPAGWNTHWLAYSSYDAILLTGAEWSGAPRNVRQAIERWVRCGGRLYVFGVGFEPPEGWPSDTAAFPTRKIFHIGLGQCRVLEQDDDDAREQILQDLNSMMNSGRGYTTTTTPTTEGSIPLLGGLREGVSNLHQEDYYRRFGGPFGSDSESDFNRYFPVVNSSHAPVRLVLGLLTLFVILAGPVTLILLSRKGKRIWFLWTLPALAFGVSALVFIVSFFSEGVTPRIRLASVTMLDQANQEATTLGAVAVYAPIAPGQLAFDGVSEVTPLLDPNSDDPGGGRRVAWTDGGQQRFEGNWVASRVPAHFAIRKSEHREERLEVTWSAGDIPEIMNGLGGHINQLHLCRHDGTVFTGENITAGKRVTLREVSGSRSRNDFNSLTNLLTSTMTSHTYMIDPSQMVPGVYWATMSSSPFLENPMEGRTSKLQVQSQIVGILGYGDSGKPGP